VESALLAQMPIVPRECPALETAVSVPFAFEALPFVVEGNSKIVRRWNSSVVLVKLKPTVYSYTHNRTGIVYGSDEVRARFTALIYDRMGRELAPKFCAPIHAFLGLIEGTDGPLLAQREVEACNLEVRVKRYHVGSPLHRYRQTELYASTQECGPITKWSRFETPIVCFDWRHPMFDEQGNRLSDEPLSDDYAAIWMEDVPYAKALAREAFLWMEKLFESAGITLIDICFFIDRTGRLIYGEISPDCMRARIGTGPVSDMTSLDKDVWREGLSSQKLLERYQKLFDLLAKESGDA
jgi:phosphoribosylaminoimidazole-succinocarboxamide synthase